MRKVTYKYPPVNSIWFKTHLSGLVSRGPRAEKTSKRSQRSTFLSKRSTKEYRIFQKGVQRSTFSIKHTIIYTPLPGISAILSKRMWHIMSKNEINAKLSPKMFKQMLPSYKVATKILKENSSIFKYIFKYIFKFFKYIMSLRHNILEKLLFKFSKSWQISSIWNPENALKLT